MARLIALIFLPCFVRKLDSGVRRHDCVNCTHLPDICRVLSVLQVQILDPYFISDRENVDWKTFSIPFLVLLRSTPLFHHHSIFILYYLFYVHHHEKSSNHFTPVIVIIFYSSYHPRIMHKIMYIRASYSFCVGSSNPFCVIYFMPAWYEGWQICVDTTLINEFAYICLYVNTMRL